LPASWIRSSQGREDVLSGSGASVSGSMSHL